MIVKIEKIVVPTLTAGKQIIAEIFKKIYESNDAPYHVEIGPIVVEPPQKAS